MPYRYLGQQIAKYRVTRLLGVGAFAWVYEAIDQDLEIPVALKILRPEFAGLADAESRFRREAALAARLRHRNIVTVRDVGAADGVVFVAMDLLPLTLGRRLALTYRLPESECVRVGIDVASALAIAHEGGIIHRDIKPDNILLATNGDAVVADFGLARALTGTASVSATNQVLGTPHYFSPEQARGHELDGRSDLYSLGVTLYRAATGQLPFEGDDWYAVAREHIESTPVAPREQVPELTPEYDAIVMRLLSKRPEHRFATATQLVDALASLPSAPAHRSGASLPRMGSHTVDAFRPQASRFLGTWTAVTGLLLVITATAWWQSGRTAANDVLATAEAPDSTLLFSDTTLFSPSATIPPLDLLADSVDTNAATQMPEPARQRPRPPRLDLLAPDSAQIYVDNRLVGTGRWTGEHSAANRVAIRAVLPNAPTSCDAAILDTVVRLVAGDRVTVELPVRSCVGLMLDIQPRDARLTFTPLDGGHFVELRADTTTGYLLPVGRYAVNISAPRCITISDTLTVRRGANGAPNTIWRRMSCN